MHVPPCPGVSLAAMLNQEPAAPREEEKDLQGSVLRRRSNIRRIYSIGGGQRCCRGIKHGRMRQQAEPRNPQSYHLLRGVLTRWRGVVSLWCFKAAQLQAAWKSPSPRGAPGAGHIWRNKLWPPGVSRRKCLASPSRLRSRDSPPACRDIFKHLAALAGPLGFHKDFPCFHRSQWQCIS